MKHSITSVCGALLLLFAAAGCTAIARTPAVTQTPAEPQEIEQAIACGDALLTAIQQGKYEDFVRNLSERMKQEVSQQQFEAANRQMSEQFGQIVQFRYLINLAAPEVNNMLWVVTFERTGSEGQKITREILFRMVSGMIDDQIEIFSFGFF